MKQKNKYYHSFVIPTAGRSQYLETCIKSLKNQKIKSKIIMTTSKPYKGLHQIAKKFNIKLFIFKKHNNIANDWNRAIKMSKSNSVQPKKLYQCPNLPGCFVREKIVCLTIFS